MPLYRRPTRQDKNTDEIFVIDDQPRMRDITRMMLRGNGYGNVFTFDRAKQALLAMERRTVILVVTDWNMPNMTGIELLTQIKSDPLLFRIPVIMISDERTDDKLLYAVEEGVDSILVKPFNERDLIKYVKLTLEKSARHDPLEEKIAEMRRLKLSKEYQAALEMGNDILKIRPNPRVALMTCECLYQIEEYGQALAIMSDTEDDHQGSQQANLSGKIYLKLGQYDQALLALEEAVRRNPLNHDRKIDLAGAYFATGRVDDGEKIVHAIVNANPTDLNLIAIADLYLDRGDLDTAGKYLKQTVDPIKETVPVFNNYAIALRRADRFEEAAHIYLKCIKINPDSDVLYYNLALLYTKMGRRKEAKETLRNVLKLNPENPHARDLLTRLERDEP